MSEPLSCEERGGFCAVRTLSEHCQNTVRTLSERCQNGQVSVRTSVGSSTNQVSEGGEALSSVHPPTPATGKLIHDLLCDGRVKND